MLSICYQHDILTIVDDDLVLTASISVAPVEHILCEGALTDIPVGQVKAGSDGLIQVSVCFIAVGTFTVQTVSRSVDGRGRIVGQSEIEVYVRESATTS